MAANRIREFREARGMTRATLAEAAGTSPNQLVKLENGDRRLSDHWADRLAVPLEVRPWELMMRPGEVVPLRYIPVVGDISCGNWKEAVEQSSTSIPATEGGSNSFALRATGDSMNLLIADGGYVIVDPGQPDLLDGKVFVAMNGDGETTAKRYRADPPRLEPCSSNPDHKPILIGREHFTIIGRVVQAITPM